MKVEKFLKVFFLVVCTMTMAFNFTACSEDDDISPITIITYRANGSISASSSDAFEALFAITDYTDAITKVLGNNYTTTERDKDVVSACDAVYQNHRTKHPTWKGYIEIEKSKVGHSGEILSSEIIKSYNYE